jgi:hypothetical protein
MHAKDGARAEGRAAEGKIGGVEGIKALERITRRSAIKNPSYRVRESDVNERHFESILDWLAKFPDEKVRREIAPLAMSPLLLRDIAYVRPQYFPHAELQAQRELFAQSPGWERFRAEHLEGDGLFKAPLTRRVAGDAIMAFAALEDERVSADYARFLAERNVGFLRREIELMLELRRQSCPSLEEARDRLLKSFFGLCWDIPELSEAKNVCRRATRVDELMYLNRAKWREEGGRWTDILRG